MRTKTYDGVTPEFWAELKANVEADIGQPLTGDEGKGERYGVTFSYSYDAPSQRLTITEVSRSFYDPSEDSIIQKINDGVEEVLDPK